MLRTLSTIHINNLLLLNRIPQQNSHFLLLLLVLLLLLLLRPLLLLLLQINIDTIVTNVTKSSRDPMNCRHMSLLNMVKVSLVNSDHQPFSSNAALKVHIKQKHGEGTAVNYQCPNCNYTSNRKDAVTAHEVKQHGRKLREDEIVKCPIADKGCTKTFLTMENCEWHVRLICQKQADVKCQDPTCTRQFKNKNQMLVHYQIHTPEGQKWLCSVCNKQCASQQSYNNHMKKHQKQ